MSSNNSGIIVGFFVGLFLIYTSVKRYLLVKKIRETPTSKVDAVAIGLVELSGTAECHEPIIAPISGEKCAYWKITCEYFWSGKNPGWVLLYQTSTSSRFYLQDDTGKMLVDPNGAEIDIPLDNTIEGFIADNKGLLGLGATKTTMPKEGLDFINGLDQKTNQRILSHKSEKIRLQEYHVEEDDPLFVLGSAEPLDMALSENPPENIIVKKGDLDKTMYISNTGERQVIGKLSKYMRLKIFGGLALSTICLIMILLYLHIR